jgi:hypothetical protein
MSLYVLIASQGEGRVAEYKRHCKLPESSSTVVPDENTKPHKEDDTLSDNMQSLIRILDHPVTKSVLGIEEHVFAERVRDLAGGAWDSSDEPCSNQELEARTEFRLRRRSST